MRRCAIDLDLDLDFSSDARDTRTDDDDDDDDVNHADDDVRRCEPTRESDDV